MRTEVDDHKSEMPFVDRRRYDKQGRTEELTDARIAGIVKRLAANKRIRRTLQPWGRVHIDRQVPFLSVYRRPTDQADPGTPRLVVGGAAYLNASGDKPFQRPLSRLVEGLVALMTDRFGAHLLLEVWAADAPHHRDPEAPPRPTFRIYHPLAPDIQSTVNTLRTELAKVTALKQRAEVDVQTTSRIAPPGMQPLLAPKRLRELGGYLLGLEVSPIYIDPKTGDLYPLLLRHMRRQLGRVLHRTFYEFSHERTTHQPPHYHALGRRATVKAVWEVDQQLAAVSDSLDFLYQITPVNAEQAWRTFRRKRFEVQPAFLYRPRSLDPALAKRQLYDARIEQLEDPTLQHMFLEKQTELDRQLTMLHDLGTKRFLYESLQQHGNVEPALVEAAKEILDHTPARSRAQSRGVLSPEEFAQRAHREIQWYADKSPEFKAVALVSDDMYSGLLVSRGRLLIGRDTRIPEQRAEALLQHEVGTHLLTYFNARAQPFRMLQSGLPGYDALQEGLAVLSEYLVGGLTAARLRVLAARVIAARALVDGVSFVEVFRELTRTHGFDQRSAYTTTMRVFRGGGLLKDAVYLRGLLDILKYLAKGGDFDILFIGKIAAKHVGVIEELMLRKILKPPPLYPRYLENEDARKRLAGLRRETPVLDLLGK
ncbi:MAG: flavohemoglobin expression-modulating QEGLA motif protein [Candidatus Krumholzibacteria bacterium]|nr:flavohemoglobin expression-modulating QEGLA motif protein [Candidatus Krumholzibacteria bacterium]